MDSTKEAVVPSVANTDDQGVSAISDSVPASVSTATYNEEREASVTSPSPLPTVPQESREASQPPPKPTESQQPPKADSLSDASDESPRFTIEQRRCLQDALGESIFNDLANRDPTTQELAKFAHCGVDQYFAHGDSESGHAPPPHENAQNSSSDQSLSDFMPLDYPRIYPEVIKGLWEPGAWDQLAAFVDTSSGEKHLRATGINTISVVASFDVHADGEYSFPFGASFIEQEIVRYKKLGFSVFLSGNCRGSSYDDDRQKALEKYLLACKSAAIELARIGEYYNVEYFSPSNEFEGSLSNEAFPSALQSHDPPETVFDPYDAATDARVKAASQWFVELLPGLKEEYSGQVIAKVGSAHPGYRVRGYDYLAFTLDHHYLDEAEFRRLVRKQYNEIAIAAAASETAWMVGEAYFHYGDEGSELDDETVAFLKGMQYHYFDISFNEYHKFDELPKPLGYIFIGYFMEGIRIRGTDSESVIIDNFTQMD